MNVTQPQSAIKAFDNGPIFGVNNDIFISDSSNSNMNSYSNLNLSSSFKLPSFLLNSSGGMANVASTSFLTGSNSFVTFEIETYTTDRK